MQQLTIQKANNALHVISPDSGEVIGYITINTQSLAQCFTVLRSFEQADRDEETNDDGCYNPEPSKQYAEVCKSKHICPTSADIIDELVKESLPVPRVVQRLDAVAKLAIVQSSKNSGQIRKKQKVATALVSKPHHPTIAKIHSKNVGVCPVCDSTGKYRNAKYSRDCFRCAGKGWMSENDILRYDGWAATRRVANRKTFQDYNNKYTCH
jgi:hypothetical protein